jgi:hypothetical protein
MTNTKFPTQEVATKTQGFSIAKDHTPPEIKANHKLPLKPRQIKPSAKLNDAKKQKKKHKGLVKQDRYANLEDRVTLLFRLPMIC